MNILIVYYSGVGNTKMVATKIFEKLRKQHQVNIVSIEMFAQVDTIECYDALVMGFPTIHASPATTIVKFLEQLEPLQKRLPTFLFTTCGLYSANTLRIFSKKCTQKNLVPILTKSYRCAATDGVLIAPFMNVWLRHEKKLDEKIENSLKEFVGGLNQPIKSVIPRFKLYSILNYPNKFFGQHFLPAIYIHKSHCTLCKKCIRSCPAKIISEDIDGYPVIDGVQCIHCYRCIHHCPQKALSLSKAKRPKKTLSY